MAGGAFVAQLFHHGLLDIQESRDANGAVDATAELAFYEERPSVVTKGAMLETWKIRSTNIAKDNLKRTDSI